MTWVLYVLFMAEDRTLQHIAEKKFFETEQACYAHYNNNKESIDKSIYTIIRPRINKSHILHVGCIPPICNVYLFVHALQLDKQRMVVYLCKHDR